MAEVDFRGGAKLATRPGTPKLSQHDRGFKGRHAFHGAADVGDQRGVFGDPVPNHTTIGRSRSARSLACGGKSANFARLDLRMWGVTVASGGVSGGDLQLSRCQLITC